MDRDEVLRKNLKLLLTGETARMPFDEAVSDLLMDRINDPLPNANYTPWHLLEHIRFAQRDILEFITDPDYRERKWPDEYWPPRDKKATPEDWKKSIDGFKQDFLELKRLIEDPATDLYALIPWGSGQTFITEIVTVSNHNGFHIGEFAITRQAMGTWGKGHRG